MSCNEESKRGWIGWSKYYSAREMLGVEYQWKCVGGLADIKVKMQEKNHTIQIEQKWCYESGGINWTLLAAYSSGYECPRQCIKYTNRPDNPEGGSKGVQAMTNDLYPCICIKYNSSWMKKMERGKGTYFLKDYCNNLHEIWYAWKHKTCGGLGEGKDKTQTK